MKVACGIHLGNVCGKCNGLIRIGISTVLSEIIIIVIIIVCVYFTMTSEFLSV